MGLTSVWNCLQEQISEYHKIPLPIMEIVYTFSVISYLYLYFKFAQVTSVFSLPCLRKKTESTTQWKQTKLQILLAELHMLKLLL